MGSSNPSEPTLPYWQISIPPSQYSTTCPPFLQNLLPKELSIISTPHHLYHILSWPEVLNIIAINDLDAFQRTPSDLRRYLSYNHFLKQKYGSVMNFVLSERLGWSEPIVPQGKPFERDSDVKVLWNDWPYGVDGKIVHLVVWTKFGLEEDLRTGDLSEETRVLIGEYVDRRFRDVVGGENVVWFRNWTSLKSINAVEHFHIMLYDPNPEFVKMIASGDVPLSQKV